MAVEWGLAKHKDQISRCHGLSLSSDRYFPGPPDNVERLLLVGVGHHRPSVVRRPRHRYQLEPARLCPVQQQLRQIGAEVVRHPVQDVRKENGRPFFSFRLFSLFRRRAEYAHEEVAQRLIGPGSGLMNRPCGNVEAGPRLDLIPLSSNFDCSVAGNDIEQLDKDKEKCVSNQDFEKAARFRDQEKQSRQELDKKLHHWKNGKIQEEIIVEDIEVKKALELGAGEFIKKPYSLKQLGIAVQNELKK